MPRATGEDTKAAIRAVALRQFAEHGHDLPLESIASELGITRSAILHHFGSKDNLLVEVVRPFEEGLDGMLDEYRDAAVPLTRVARRRILERAVQIYCDHRQALVLTFRDMADNWPHHPMIAGRIGRFGVLLGGEHPSQYQRVVVDAVLGAVVRPLLDPTVDADDPAARALMTAVALDVAKRLDRADPPAQG